MARRAACCLLERRVQLHESGKLPHGSKLLDQRRRCRCITAAACFLRAISSPSAIHLSRTSVHQTSTLFLSATPSSSHPCSAAHHIITLHRHLSLFPTNSRPNMHTCLAILLTCCSRSRYQVGYISSLSFHTVNSFRPSTFSPEGRLFQVEYSLEAIKLGSTAIGVCSITDYPTGPSISNSQTGRNLRGCHPWCREARHFNTARNQLRREDCRDRQTHWCRHVRSAGRRP